MAAAISGAELSANQSGRRAVYRRTGSGRIGARLFLGGKVGQIVYAGLDEDLDRGKAIEEL